jgi:hypothetical protein
MGAEISRPLDKETEQCLRACVISDFTDKLIKENEHLAGMSRDDVYVFFLLRSTVFTLMLIVIKRGDCR